ncbi:MAG: efflux RND transporter periplasmic adaptor subunit [Holophaga sp.]|nr:efflux RND transporter periplasmic adaptor subunit [Holophaga sp.]
MRNRTWTGLGPVVGILVAGGLVTGCAHRQGPPPVSEVAVSVIQPERVTLTTELPGRTSAYLVAEVRPQVNGIIQQRAFTEGSDVRTGALLYQIDPAPYKAALASAQATLAKAQASLPPLQSKMQRDQELVKIDAIGKQELEEAVSSSRQAEAEILAGKAAVDTARINLGYTRITAPISGRISKSSVTVGALATSYSGTAFTTIQQLDPVYVDAPQSTGYLLQLKRNMASGRIKGGSADQAKVKLLLEDGTPYPQQGVLKFSDVTVDPTTGSLTLRMVFPNPGHVLLPGMYVRAVVDEGVAEQAILVPQQGVTHNPKGEPTAMVVDPSGKVEQRFLKIDRAVGSRWLVTDGLKAGDRLIMEGLQKVRPGMPVTVVPFHATPAPQPTAGN